MTENQKPVLVCMSIEEMPEPRVPSILTECMKCTTPVWRSVRSLAETEVVEAICMRCAIREDTEVVDMLPSVRAELLDSGWTLAETEAADRYAADLLRRGQMLE